MRAGRSCLLLALVALGTQLSAGDALADIALPQMPAALSDEAAIDLAGSWRFATDSKAIGDTEDWGEKGIPVDIQRALNVPGYWEDQGITYDGVAWLQLDVDVPAAWLGERLLLALPPIDETDRVWINGQVVGGMRNDFRTPRRYWLPTGLLKPIGNRIVIRILDGFGKGGVRLGSCQLVRPGFRTITTGATGSATQALALAMGPSAGTASGWVYGRRDPGTSDTRPALAAVEGRSPGVQALDLDIRYPWSNGEFVDHRLAAEAGWPADNANDWDALALWYLADSEGDLRIALADGPSNKKPANEFATRFALVPGAWKRVVLPLAWFTRSGKEHASPLRNLAACSWLSIGYKNNEIRSPGHLRISEIALLRSSAGARLAPVSVAGTWLGGKAALAQPWNWVSFPAPWSGFATAKGAEWKADDGSDAWYALPLRTPQAWAGLPWRLIIDSPPDRDLFEVRADEIRLEREDDARRLVFASAQGIPEAGQHLLTIRHREAGGIAGFLGRTASLEPVWPVLSIRDVNGSWTPLAGFDPGVKPAPSYRMRLGMPAAAAVPGARCEVEVRDCFHRDLAVTAAIAADGGSIELSLDGVAARRFFYSESLTIRGRLWNGDELIAGFGPIDADMRYEARDRLVLPELPAAVEDVGYGPMRLVDRVDAAADTTQDPHPYKEGGIRNSWVGRRAYSTWEDGIAIGRLSDVAYREAGNCEWFGYRLGRGKLIPHRPYLLRVVYPEDKTRYVCINVDAGRNYHGTGFRTGIAPGHPFAPFPISGRLETFDLVVVPDDTGYGWRGSRTGDGSAGLWVFFHDIGRCFAGQYQAGPAVAELRLYELSDAPPPPPTAPGGATRILALDWEREPEAPADDVVALARLSGANAVAPPLLKWGGMAYWRTQAPVSVLSGGRHREALADGRPSPYEDYLAATRRQDLRLIPRLEFGGSKAIPEDQRAVDIDGKPVVPNRFGQWCPDLTRPAIRQELEGMVDEIIAAAPGEPQLFGLLWRLRGDRFPISYAEPTIAAFAAADHATAPARKELRAWLSDGGRQQRFVAWWHAQRRDLHRALAERLRAKRPDLQMFYYNWDPDDWTPGQPKLMPDDYTHRYSRTESQLYFAKVDEALAAFGWDALRQQLRDGLHLGAYGGRVHHAIWPELYQDPGDPRLIAPVHGWNLANNPAYLDYFRGRAGLAVSMLYPYEEKGRENVQGDFYETSELSAGSGATAMAEEVGACFHADPTAIFWTTYTPGRGFAREMRRFSRSFLALPPSQGTVVDIPGLDPRVRMRSYQHDGRRLLGIASIAETPLRIVIQAAALGGDAASKAVDNLADSVAVPWSADGTLVIDLPAMSLTTLALR